MWLVIALFACGGSSPGHGGAVDGHDHAGHDGHAGHDHGGGAAHGDHMAKMSAKRDALRQELGDAYDAPVPGLDLADDIAGKALYEQHCMGCHGLTGHGDGSAGAGLPTAPADFTDPLHSRFYSDAGRIQVIKKGHTEEGMPAFEGTLTDEQILQVYRYVRAFRR